MAEEKGFEPLHTVTCLRAFQARPFSLLGIPPYGLYAFLNIISNALSIILKKLELCSNFLSKLTYNIHVMQKYIVSDKESGQTLEKYVKKVLKVAPLSFIYKLFRKKDVKVNGHWEKEKFVELGKDMDIMIIDAAALKNIKPLYKENPDMFDSCKAWNEEKVYIQLAYNAYYTNYELALINAWFIAKSVYPDLFSDIDENLEDKKHAIYYKCL